MRCSATQRPAANCVTTYPRTSIRFYSGTGRSARVELLLFGENTCRVTYAQSLQDAKQHLSFDYDQVGRLRQSFTGTAARAHVGLPGGAWIGDGPYAMPQYEYDQWGNMIEREEWIKDQQDQYVGLSYGATINPKNQLIKNPATGAAMTYDLAGNLASDGSQTFKYDATGQQVTASGTTMTQSYDGERLRVKKVESGETTYYVRSSMMGGQVVAELNEQGQMTRGYVYMGGQLLAIQQDSQVTWVHQDPVTKSQRFTNSAGALQSQRIDLDPWGNETGRTVDPATPQQKPTHRFTTYERDANGTDEAMHRRYNSVRSRFEQPDPWDGSYELTNPQSFNRYSYVRNDPVNFVDPSGLEEIQTIPCQTADGKPCEVTVTTSFEPPTAATEFINWVTELNMVPEVEREVGERAERAAESRRGVHLRAERGCHRS